MVIQFEPLSRATPKRVSIAIAQFELNVFVISFYGFRTNPEFLRDPTGSEARTAQSKDMQLAICQIRRLSMCCRSIDDLANGAQCDPRANVKLTSKDRINSADQFLPRTGLHPVP